MPDINRAALDAAFTRYSNEFQSGLSNTPNMEFMSLVKEFGSSTASSFYTFLAKNLKFREWVGPRKFNDLQSKNFEVVNKKFELSVRMPEDDISDDTLNVYDPIIQEMGQAWMEEKLFRATNVVIDNATCFTGDALFANTHASAYSGTLDNLVTTTLSDAAIDAADATAGSWKMENGRPTATRWDTLVVGPSLEHRAWDIMKNRLVGNGSGAAIDQYFSQGRTFKICVNPYFTAGAGLEGGVDAEYYWMLADTSRPMSGIGLQMRSDVELIGDTDPAQVQRTGNIDYMAKGRFETFPIFPHLVYLSQSSS